MVASWKLLEVQKSQLATLMQKRFTFDNQFYRSFRNGLSSSTNQVTFFLVMNHEMFFITFKDKMVSCVPTNLVIFGSCITQKLLNLPVLLSNCITCISQCILKICGSNNFIRHYKSIKYKKKSIRMNVLTID